MRKISLIVILFVSVFAVKAQRGIAVQNIVLSTPIIDSLEDDSYSLSSGVWRDMKLNCLENNQFAQKEDAIWQKQIKIQSESAKEIKIVFKKFILSSNAVISFYTDSLQYQCWGTSFVHKPDSSYISNFLRGDNCTIVIEIPIDELDKNQIIISRIYHFTESFYETMRADYSCMIDVNCLEGNNWCDQKRSVALYSFPKTNGKMGKCTGVLVNNYRNNYAQYFLTARHCTDEVENWNETEFYFKYQKIFCSSDTHYSGGYTVQGSQMVGYCDVTWSDNALLLITEPIPIQYNVYYAGVDITDRSTNDGVTCIHHSDGLPKKITSGKIKYFAGTRWDVYWDDGIIMPGGSGAPVFLNSNKWVIANISRGPSYDCNSSMKHDWVGKIKSCMPYSSNMKDALFGNSGLESYAGIDPIKDCQSNLNLQGEFHKTQEYDATLDGLTIQAGNKITVSNAVFSSGSNHTLTAGNSIVFLPGTVIKAGATFSAKITHCSGNLVSCGTHTSKQKSMLHSSQEEDDEDIDYEYATKEKELYSEIITIQPNPNNGTFTINTNFDPQEIISVQVFSIVGQSIYKQEGLLNYTIQLPIMSNGMFFIEIKTITQKFTRKIIVFK